MPELKTYDLFISHAWKYGDEYCNLIYLLDKAPCFSYRNYSPPPARSTERAFLCPFLLFVRLDDLLDLVEYRLCGFRFVMSVDNSGQIRRVHAFVSGLAQFIV